jgi:DNA-binding CsgD family transcriptional regulator
MRSTPNVPGETEPADQSTCIPLVEREREEAVLSELVRGTAAGRPGLVLLEGPAGIGRSALLRRLAGEAREAGMQVLEASGTPTERGIPFGVVRELFGPLITAADEWGHPRPDRDRIPQTGLVFDALLGGGTGTADGAPYGVLVSLHRFICCLATRDPLAVIVDNAESADRASLRLMAHVARRLAGLPVLLALSQRTDTDEHVAQLDEIAAQPLCRNLRLRPLSDSGVARMLRQITDVDGAELASARLAASSGNPLLITTLFAALGREGRPSTPRLADVGNEDIPVFGEQVQRVLRQQSAATVSAVRAMAVLGEGAPSQAYARLARLDTAVFAQAVLTLGSLGLVTATPDGSSWSFGHRLVQDAVLMGLPPEVLAGQHRHAARLLLDSGASVERVAGHLQMAQARVTDRWAVIVLREAARKAVLSNDAAAGVDLLRLCLSENPDPARDAELLVELGLAEAGMDAEASIRHLRSAVGHVSNPQLRLTALSTLADGLVRTGHVLEAQSLLVAHLDGTYEDGSESAGLLEALRLQVSTFADIRSFRRMSDTSFALDLPGDTPSERALLATRAFMSVTRAERAPEALTAARRVIAQATPTSDSPSFIVAAAATLLLADRPDEAAPALRQFIDATEQGLTGQSSILLAVHAETCRRMGALEDAIADTGAILDRAQEKEFEHLFALPAAVRLQALLDRGDITSAAAIATLRFAPAVTDTWQWNDYLSARGRLRLMQSGPETALVDLLESGRRQQEWNFTNPAKSSWWFWAGTAHLQLGDTSRARDQAEEAIAAARIGDLPSVLGMGLQLLAATHSGSAKLALLEEAEAVLETTAAPLSLTRAQVAYGTALHASGHTQAARKVLRRGLETAYTLGAMPLYRQARQSLLATGARPRRPMSSGLGSLTPSEIQVAQKAEAGLSNLQIAEALFVTQRTVEVHLTSVYRKLGISGRRELRAALGGASTGGLPPRRP